MSDGCKRFGLMVVLCAVMGMTLASCKVVDDATGVNNANVGASLEGQKGTLTRKELSQKLRRLAVSYLGTVPQACERIAASDLPLEKRLLAMRIRANSSDSIISIAADPDPQVALLNMVTVLTLQRMLVDKQGDGVVNEEFVEDLPAEGEAGGEAGADAEAGGKADEAAGNGAEPDEGEAEKTKPINRRGKSLFGKMDATFYKAAKRMEEEAWALAAQVMDEEERQQLGALIEQYRQDHPEELDVWWVRFSQFSGYKESFAVADLGRGVVDLFVPVGDAVSGIESTTDVAERATWLAARQALVVQWRVELAHLQMLSAPETTRVLDDVRRVSKTVEELPGKVATERKAIVKAVEDQEVALARLVKDTDQVITKVQQTVEQSGKAVTEVNQAITAAESTIEKAQPLVKQSELTLAQLEKTSDSLNKTLQTLDGFMKQFESEDEDAPPARPFDITEYTTAVQEAGKTIEQLNTLVTNVDGSTQPEKLEKTLGTVQGRLSTLIWQGGAVLLVVGLVLIIAGKLIPKRGKA